LKQDTFRILIKAVTIALLGMCILLFLRRFHEILNISRPKRQIGNAFKILVGKSKGKIPLIGYIYADIRIILKRILRK
jgi:hypothetical protein